MGVALTCLLVTASLAADVAVKGSIVYAERPGWRPRLTLTLPTDETLDPRPCVVLLHGGSWFFGTRHQLRWYARRLAENGYVAAAVSYRMMPKYPFPYCLHDCKAAVRWLRLHASQYRLDPDRIAVLGNSAGGHLAALLATTSTQRDLEGPDNPGASSAVQAAVVLYGVVDLSYYRHPKGYISMAGLTHAYVKQFVGQPDDRRDPFDAASPVTYADRSTCPILFVHGSKDGFVPYGQMLAFCEQLKRLGVPTRLITVPYGHAFDFFHPRVRAAVFKEMLDFLNRYSKTQGLNDRGIG